MANTEIYHYEVVAFSGKYEWIFKVPTKDTQLDIVDNGI